MLSSFGIRAYRNLHRKFFSAGFQLLNLSSLQRAGATALIGGLWMCGESDEIDHLNPEETDQGIRGKLTTKIRTKLTTLIRSN